METVQDYANALRAEPRSLRRKHLLQTASNHLPPGALSALYLQLNAIGGPALCQDAPQYRYMTARARLRAARLPQLLADHRHKSHSLFTTPDIPRAQKRLFILLSGEDGQFYLPLATVLHNLPKGPKDVLVLRGGSGSFFANGVAGFGGNPLQVAQTIRQDFAATDYACIAVLGFSAGGVYALRVADMLGADLGLSFGGRFAPKVPRVAVNIAGIGSGFDVFCACRPQRAARLVNVAGAKHELDAHAMQRMQAVRPKLVRHYLINYASHNVLQRMLRFGTLRPFIGLCLMHPALLRSVNAPFWAYGSFVRGLRKLVGVQR